MSRWIVYTSNESHRNEIYVTPFRRPDGKWRISTAGGDQPLWRNDGNEIFYISADRMLINGCGGEFEERRV